MLKNKKNGKFGLFLTILFVVIAIFVAMQSLGGNSEFFNDYMSNFKKNTQTLIQKFNIPIPDSWKSSTAVSNISVEQNGEDISQTESPSQKSVSIADTPIEKSERPKKAETTEASAKGSHIMAFENAGSVQYARYKDYLVCANQTSLMAFDKNGQSLWAIAAQNMTPILKTAGNYILLAEKGGTKISVFKADKLLYSVETENAIISVSISSNCDVVAVTEKPNYRGSVIVYNKEGKEIFVWNSGNNDILDASIATSSRRVAVALLNSESGIKGSVEFFDITKTESYAKQEFEDSIVFDVEFLGETLNAICDNKVIGLSNRGKISWTRDYEGKLLSKYGLENSGLKMFMFDDSIAAEVALFDSRGNQKASLKSEEIPDFVDIYSGYIAYNNGRELLFGNLTGRNMKQYQSSKDITNAIVLGVDSIVIVYNSSLEFLHL